MNIWTGGVFFQKKEGPSRTHKESRLGYRLVHSLSAMRPGLMKETDSVPFSIRGALLICQFFLSYFLPYGSQKKGWLKAAMPQLRASSTRM